MWRQISRPAPALAVLALLALAGCGEGEQTTSAGAQVTTPTTSVAPTTAATVAATTTTAAAARCADVSFSSNPDDKASEVKATGLSCAEAEALVRKVGPDVKGIGGPAQVTSDGFVCNRTNARAGDHGPPSATFDCVNGAMRVNFIRS